MGEFVFFHEPMFFFFEREFFLSKSAVNVILFLVVTIIRPKLKRPRVVKISGHPCFIYKGHYLVSSIDPSGTPAWCWIRQGTEIYCLRMELICRMNIQSVRNCEVDKLGKLDLRHCWSSLLRKFGNLMFGKVRDLIIEWFRFI